MTEITINNLKIDTEINLKDLSLRELRALINKIVLDNGNVIKTITLDDTSLNEVDLQEIEKESVENYKAINFKTISKIDLAFEALESSHLYLTTLCNKITDLSSLYKKNEVKEANALFIEVTSILDLFIQLMSQVQNVLKNHDDIKFQKTDKIKELEIGLLNILKSLVPARQNNDMIMLCDLLEYELTDNLDQWKNQVIPLLESKRNLISST